MVTGHDQWIVIHDFLKTIVGRETVDNVLKEGRKFYLSEMEPFMPIE
jgi:hypothetical protein